MAGEAAGVPDRASAAHLVEQPLGAELGVLDLVVVQVPGVRVGDIGVDRDRHDARVVRFGECRVERVRIVRVEDERVDVLRDQVRRSDSCPAASVLRWMTLSLEILSVPSDALRPWPCRPAPRGSRCRRRRRSSSPIAYGALLPPLSRRCTRRATSSIAGQQRRRSMPCPSFRSLCEQFLLSCPA